MMGGGDGGYDDSYDPDGDNGYNDWIDDYGNHHQDDRDQNQQDDKKGDFGNQQEKKTLDTKKAKAEFKGFVSEKTAEKLGIEPRNCFVVAKSVMASFGQNWVHGSSETNYQITLIRSENGTGVPVTGSIPDAIQYITSRIDGNGPVLVGIDYNGDGLNDHWFVIYGYWQNSNTTIEFLYAETGTGNVGYAFSETNILSYTIGDDYISGPHWLFPDKYENHVRQVRINP